MGAADTGYGLRTPYPSTGISWPEFMRYLEVMSSFVIAALDAQNARVLEVRCFWTAWNRSGTRCILGSWSMRDVPCDARAARSAQSDVIEYAKTRGHMTT